MESRRDFFRGSVVHQDPMKKSGRQLFCSFLKKGDVPGTPKDMGPPYGKLDPNYSHIFRDSYGSGMGIVWVRGPIKGP